MQKLHLRPRLYGNKRLALELICEDGEPWSTLTTNIVDAYVAPDEICIPQWNLPSEVLEGFLTSGKFEDTGKVVETGFVEAPVWKVVCPDLLAKATEMRIASETATERMARTTITPLADFKLALPMLCRSGCDRTPIRVGNRPEPFFLAGVDDTHIYLTHPLTCAVFKFGFDELELPTLAGMREIQQLIIAWTKSAEGAASTELTEYASQAASQHVTIPVTIRWPHDANSRDGILTLTSTELGKPTTQWVAAIEASSGQSVVFRYGLSRIARALHDGKKLTMQLKPGTGY